MCLTSPAQTVNTNAVLYDAGVAVLVQTNSHLRVILHKEKLGYVRVTTEAVPRASRAHQRDGNGVQHRAETLKTVSKVYRTDFRQLLKLYEKSGFIPDKMQNDAITTAVHQKQNQIAAQKKAYEDYNASLPRVVDASVDHDTGETTKTIYDPRTKTFYHYVNGKLSYAHYSP